MKIRKVINFLETIAPPSYQESYDNSGLLVGDANKKLTGTLLCLDAIEEVVEEAIELGCNLIIAHHPIIFGGLKSLTGKNYIERTIIKAIKNDIAIYACHTNLDNVSQGVNAKIAQKIGLENTRILAPKSGMLRKLEVMVPIDSAAKVRQALFDAGAGSIGKYQEASYNVVGAGTFKAGEGAKPHKGEKGKRHTEAEFKIEVIFPFYREGQILQAMQTAHPYEEVAYYVTTISNKYNDLGSGMIGKLAFPMEEVDFLQHLKSAMQTDCVRYTALRGVPIKTVAVCGGAGSFLLSNAIRAKADIFITADYKYHQFFDADGQIIIADIGHYESEQFTIELFYELLNQKFSNFAAYYTKVNTNPIKYL